MMHLRFAPLLCLLSIIAADRAVAVERVHFLRDGREQAVEGELLVTAKDGGVLVQAADGVLWTIKPSEIQGREDDDAPFEPLTQDEIAARMLEELPAGFESYQTQHYVICHNTSREYAEWCGSLLERLYRAFTNYWKQRGFKLDEPRFPLVAVLFSDSSAYRDFARRDLGDAAERVIGYYNIQNNQMIMHDLTGVGGANGNRRGSVEQINRMLAQPQAERSVATIVHEATHQIALNTGLQARYADIPLWVSEGIAVFFETPDLKSAKGWRGIGAVHRNRLTDFRDYLSRRPSDSLRTLITDDERFRGVATGQQAYSEAWALVYFLTRQKPHAFPRYLARLSEKSPLVRDTPEERLREFREFFGEDLEALDREFLRYIAKVR